MPAVCPQCQNQVPDGVQFCGVCGAPAAAPRKAIAKTMVQFSPAPATKEPPQAAAPVPQEPANQPAATPARVPVAQRTMLGITAPVADPPPPAAQPPQPVAAEPARPAPQNRTMLGVAMPGIAPTGNTPAAPPAQNRTMLGVAMPGIAPTGNAPAAPATHNRTMLGVATPGIAPTHDPPAPPVDPPAPTFAAPVSVGHMVDAPISSSNLSTPNAPKKGVPVAAVLLLLMAIVAGGGALLYVLSKRGGSALTVRPFLDAQGKDSLRIECVNCPAGTTISAGESKATVENQIAELTLAAPLQVGENKIKVLVHKPEGRDEEQEIRIPVAYRVRTDLTELTKTPPAITIRVEASPGSTATVNGQPLAIDAQGKGAVSIDVSADVTGASAEAKLLERQVPYTVTPPGGAAEQGTVAARLGIAPLRMETPSIRSITTGAHVAVQGQTLPGAAVTVNGASAPVDAHGVFGIQIALSEGDNQVSVRADAPSWAPRIMALSVKRVARAEDEIATLKAAAPMGYAEFAADPAAATGKLAYVEGEIVETSHLGRQPISLVAVQTSCSSPPCLVRILHAHGPKQQKVAVYGVVLGTFSGNGRSVPEMDATLVILGKPPSRTP